jgi:deoxyribodipyrimidine photo-lyase
MVVASFLTKDLLINWQKGEQYFMQKLIDGDVSSNNGGWQWSASCGLDPKPLRIFNPNLQAQKYDPEAKFIFKWLPELSGLNPKMVIANQIPSLERKKRNYHGPIVDHKASSSEFKKRYLEIRN